MWGSWRIGRREVPLTSKQGLTGVAPTEAPLGVPAKTSQVQHKRDAGVRAPTRARSAIQITALYREPEPEALRHARALLEFIRGECPEMAGKYVPQPHLMRTYREYCDLEGWPPRHWTAIGRQLATMTERKCVKRHGKRFRVYRIPKARRRIVSAAMQAA
jgi:hypothetical protein